MQYEIYVFIDKEKIAAYSLTGSGMTGISMSGNAVHSVNDLSGFYDNLLDYFNVDNLNECNALVRIISFDADKDHINTISGFFSGVENISLQRIEDVLPMILLNKGMLKKNTEISVNVFDNIYKVPVDENFNVTVEKSDAAELTLSIDDFRFITHFNGNGFAGEEDVDELGAQNERLQAENTELRSKCEKIMADEEELFKQIDSLQNQINKINNYLMSLQSWTASLSVNNYIGSEIVLGSFEGRLLKWKVLKKENNSVFLLCEKVLCDMKFDENPDYTNNWQQSTLRKWLNEDFYENVFDISEKNCIMENDSDKVSLLSKEEAENMMTRKERNTGAYWWLRSAYPDCGNRAWNIRGDGTIDSHAANYPYGVRPVILLKL